jgi:uncharacterized protein
MRALIFGAGGFIGRALVAELERRGDEVVTVRLGAPRTGSVGLDVAARHLLAIDGTDGLSGIDLVVHLAGERITPARWGPAKRERIRSSRIATTEALARAIARSETPPPVFVSGSATGYYGSRGEELLDESSTGGDGFLAEVCRGWESATAAAREAGVRVVTVRSGVVLDSSGGMLGSLLPPFRRGLGSRLGSGRQWMSCISLADEVAAICHLATNASSSGAYNLCAPEPIRNAAFTDALGRALGRRARLVAPRAVLRLALGRRTTDEFLLASQRVVPTRLVAEGFAFAHPSIDLALSTLVA